MSWHRDMPQEYRNQIVTGDARVLAERIPDESIDLIFTDPPYHKHFVYLFDVLGEIARRVLKPGGLLLTLSGQAYFDVKFNALCSRLDYYWVSSMPNRLGCVTRYHPKQIMNGGKPLLWFAKGTVAKHPYTFDVWPSDRDKKHHAWGQSEGWFDYYIDKLTQAGDVILDPFIGGGTVPAVCKMLGRNYVAFEIDPDTAEAARQRVRDTQPPLFVLEPQQAQLDLCPET